MYKAKNYDYLLGLPGFSRDLLKTHFTLYQGYVKNTNQILKQLESISNKSDLCYAELKRRFGWEFSGMRLHEYYFDNLGCRSIEKNGSQLFDQIAFCFGAFDRWREDFVRTALMRGIGWVILIRDNHNGKLMNCWIEQHDKGFLSGCQPILVMDVWEHAYLCEFGLNRENYIETFLNNVNWKIVIERFQHMGS